MLTVTVAPIPSGARGLYYVLASVGIFSLLVGAGVRFRRPDNQATLHFFWMTVAFFGMLAFSFSGRLDTLDWVIYWADVASLLLLPPLIVHFALVFPERPDSWAHSDTGRTPCRCCICRRSSCWGRGGGAAGRGGRARSSRTSSRWSSPRADLPRVRARRGAGDHDPRAGPCAIGDRAPAASVDRRGTAFGAVPFVFLYQLPYALGFSPLRGADWTAVLLGSCRWRSRRRSSGTG